MNFVDTASIFVRSGDGGAGHISFRREKFISKGGPDGGNGGRGGDVIFRANKQISTLVDFKFKRKFIAYNGGRGGKRNCTGKSASAVVIQVPCGTVIKDAETGEVLFDLVHHDERVTVATGGIGGRGNAEFTTAVNQAPRYAEPGRPGEEFFLELELKLLADVAIVGFPNVGKSTFISVVSAAKPKIADYEFTTLIPNLGVVRLEDEISFTIADIPGLIEGAHLGKGLGIQFLRHIERTKMLLFILDATKPNPIEDYEKLCNELRLYNPELMDKHQIIALNKSEVTEDIDQKLAEFSAFSKFNVYAISAISKTNTTPILWEIWKVLQESSSIE